jgi:hypothetical protein
MNQSVVGTASEAQLKFYRSAGSTKRAKGGPSSTAFAVFDGRIIIAVNDVANRNPALFLVLLDCKYGLAGDNYCQNYKY